MARAHITRVAAEAAVLRQHLDRPVTLAIVASSDAAGRNFIQVKRDALAEVEIVLEPAWLDDASSTADALAHVHAFNTRDDVDAIFIQFPLPPQIDAGVVADAIVVAKDIDCSSRCAFEMFVAGNTVFVPVAPHAALDLLANEFGSMEGLRVAIADDDEFGRALEVLLMRHGVAVSEDPAEADALVVAQQWPQVSASVVLDAGYYLPPRAPDWIPQHMHDRMATYLTQYGNVGPLTIAHLFEGTVRAALMHPHGMHSAESRRSDHNTPA